MLAFGFPPAAKSSSYRLREIANQFAALGWDVTVMNADRECWEQDYGIDLTMLDHVDPRVRLVELPVRRLDLDNDIRNFSRRRALNPTGWISRWDQRTLEVFPELKHGGWRDEIEKEALRLQEEQPFDLCFVSCVPYVLLTAALRLHDEHGVPFAVDFRDGWSINVLTGETAFELDSPAGRWESEALDKALSFWVVNEPIAEHYRERYPDLADKIRVVRNGFDRDSLPTSREGHRARRPLRFGYLGTVNFPPSTMDAALSGWQLARERDELLADATFEIRGHFGAAYAKHMSATGDLVRRAADHGVVMGGPVPKGEVAQLYETWDALVLMLVGGRYVTSGKVYEYMATGLPIVSIHEEDHDASRLLAGYPLWTDVFGHDPERVADSLQKAARMAVAGDLELRHAGRRHADQFDRQALMAPAVRDLADRVTR